MNNTWILWLIVFLVLYLALRRRKAAAYHHAAQLRRKRGERPIMEEIIVKYMNKGVQITTINDTMAGKLTHYSDGWLTIADAKGRERHVNADYIITIKEAAIKY